MTGLVKIFLSSMTYVVNNYTHAHSHLGTNKWLNKMSLTTALALVIDCVFCDPWNVSTQLSKVDCRDALEMICNLESDGDDTAAFSLCSAFLTRQLLQGDTYCAW